MYVALAVDHQVSAEPEHDDYGYAQHKFEGGPEHSHQADEAQAAADVFLVGGFEGGDLGLLLDIGSDDSGGGKIFLGAGGGGGGQGLDALEALVDATPEVLDDDAGYGQGQEGDQGQPGADGQHEAKGSGGEDQGIGRIHDGGA